MSLSQIRDQAEGDDQQALPAKGARKPSPATSSPPNHYCLNAAHDPRLLTENRFFYWDASNPTCPVCPVCGKQVNAQLVGYNAKGEPQIPVGLLELSSRIGESV